MTENSTEAEMIAGSDSFTNGKWQINLIFDFVNSSNESTSEM